MYKVESLVDRRQKQVRISFKPFSHLLKEMYLEKNAFLCQNMVLIQLKWIPINKGEPILKQELSSQRDRNLNSVK